MHVGVREQPGRLAQEAPERAVRPVPRGVQRPRPRALPSLVEAFGQQVRVAAPPGRCVPCGSKAEVRSAVHAFEGRFEGQMLTCMRET